MALANCKNTSAVPKQTETEYIFLVVGKNTLVGIWVQKYLLGYCDKVSVKKLIHTLELNYINLSNHSVFYRLSIGFFRPTACGIFLGC
jgi:hypothetical protein